MSADNSIFVKGVGKYFYVRAGGMTQKIEGQIDDSYMEQGRKFIHLKGAIEYAHEVNDADPAEYGVTLLTKGTNYAT